MIEEKLRLELESIFKKYKEIEQVVLFGSRARQDNKYNSDIDLCLFGEKITHLIQAKVTMDIEEVNTPLSFDILNFNELTKEKLIENIKFTKTGNARKLQNYTCSLRQQELEDLIRQHVVDDYGTGIYCLTNMDYYDENKGVLFEASDYYL